MAWASLSTSLNNKVGYFLSQVALSWSSHVWKIRLRQNMRTSRNFAARASRRPALCRAFSSAFMTRLFSSRWRLAAASLPAFRALEALSRSFSTATVSRMKRLRALPAGWKCEEDGNICQAQIKESTVCDRSFCVDELDQRPKMLYRNCHVDVILGLSQCSSNRDLALHGK